MPTSTPMLPTHILVIEDDPVVARSLREGLAREGYVVTWKNRGDEGLHSAHADDPHLIILDLRLPDASGLEICRQIRQHGLYQPILFLTQRGDDSNKVLGLEMGADDFVAKPYSLRELLARVRALLRRAYGGMTMGSERKLMHAGDLTIDFARSQVLRGRESLALTPTEYRLLVYLAQNAPHALTRAQILGAIWGHDAIIEDDRVVNVHIRRLREKVELDPNNPTIILTVPGIGYRFILAAG